MARDMVADAIRNALSSSRLAGFGAEPANVVDVLYECALAARSLSHAVTAQAAPGHDASGQHVESLTEAVMGVTAGLHAIAEAIRQLAEAVRDRG